MREKIMQAGGTTLPLAFEAEPLEIIEEVDAQDTETAIEEVKEAAAA